MGALTGLPGGLSSIGEAFQIRLAFADGDKGLAAGFQHLDPASLHLGIEAGLPDGERMAEFSHCAGHGRDAEFVNCHWGTSVWVALVPQHTDMFADDHKSLWEN